MISRVVICHAAVSTGALALALLASSVANAQSSAETAPAGAPVTAPQPADVAGSTAQAGQSSPSASQATPATSEGAAPGEIIVTAQRRSEALEKVPISVTNVTPQQVKTLNIVSLDNIQSVTPGLVFDKGYAYSQAYIRGVGTNLPNLGLENAVSTYVDGAYLERNVGSVSDLFDIGSVEVLKGAQGTLYGRNATGGTILINSADPTQTPSLTMVGEYGRFNHALGEVVANTPVTDTLSIRIAAREEHQDGYLTNLYNGEKYGGKTSYTLRGKVKWAPTSAFSAVLTLEYDKRRDSSSVSAQRFPAPICAACAIPGAGVEPVSGFYDVDNDVSKPYITTSKVANLRLRYDAGAVKFESTTGYRDERLGVTIDEDFSPISLENFSVNTGGKTFTEEFQASTDNGGWLNGLAGASYLHDSGDYQVALSGGAFAPLLAALGENPTAVNSVKTESYSGFGEIYLTPIEHLKVTLGARYTSDRRSLDSIENLSANLGLAPPGTPLAFSQHAKFHSVTPRAVVAYDLGRVNLYASYNRGFKAGGFATPIFAPTNVVKPEKIDYYETGAKFVSADRRLRLNIAGFYYKYSNIQVSDVDLAAGGLRTENAAKARGYGVDVDGTFALAAWLNVFGGASYLNAKYSSYPNGSINIPTAAGLVAGSADLSGDPLSRSPKFSGYIGATLTAPISDAWKASLTANARHTSKYDFYPDAGGPLGYDFQPRLTLMTLTGAVGPKNDSYSIGFYMNNVTDAKYYIQRATAQPFAAYETVAMPRTYGMRVTAKF